MEIIYWQSEYNTKDLQGVLGNHKGTFSRGIQSNPTENQQHPLGSLWLLYGSSLRTQEN